MARERSVHYVNSEELHEELMKSKETGTPTKRLVEIFMLITDRIHTKLYYRDPMDLEDCKQGSLHDLVKYYRNYNPKYRSSVFAYITQLAKNGSAKEFNMNHKNIKCGVQVCSLDKLNEEVGNII